MSTALVLGGRILGSKYLLAVSAVHVSYKHALRLESNVCDFLSHSHPAPSPLSLKTPTASAYTEQSPDPVLVSTGLCPPPHTQTAPRVPPGQMSARFPQGSDGDTEMEGGGGLDPAREGAVSPAIRRSVDPLRGLKARMQDRQQARLHSGSWGGPHTLHFLSSPLHCPGLDPPSWAQAQPVPSS